jgi:gliding motility-associated-like protein
MNARVRIQVISKTAPTTSVEWLPDPAYTLGCASGCLVNDVVVRAKSRLKVRSTELGGCVHEEEVELDVMPADMRLEINSSSCFSNTQTHVSFTIHMGNGYDTVFKDIPVVFYDGDPMAGSSVILQTFLTPQKMAGSSAVYRVVVPTPKSGLVYMRVNQKSGVSIPDPVFPETDFSNNQVKVPAEAFKITISPKDTTVTRLTTLNLSTSTVSGTASTYAWKAASALSCTDCPNPVIKVPFSQTITLLAQNQFSCTDSDTLIVKTYTDKRYNLPTAFTPNGDGLNDVFYMIGNREIAVIREFSVYDRYGQRIFHRTGIKPNDPVYGWDGTRNGKPVTMGTYAYTFRVELVDGTIELLKGLVTLIR